MRIVKAFKAYWKLLIGGHNPISKKNKGGEIPPNINN